MTCWSEVSVRAILVACLATIGRPAMATAQDAPAPGGAAAPARGPVERSFGDLELTLRFPAEWQLVAGESPTDPQVRAAWTGKLGGSRLQVRLVLLGAGAFGLQEPSEVIELIGSNLSDPASGGDPGFHFDSISNVPGPYGWAGYVTVASDTEKGDGGSAQGIRLAGLLRQWAYAVEVVAQPALPAADAKALAAALPGCVSYAGEARDPKWTEAEAKERWAASAPDELHDDLDDVLRTAHYIILTNSSGGKAFAKKMEECYAAIRKVYPFDEVPERRLMPVFLFRTNDQYYGFFAKAFGMTVEDARRTGGVSSGDFYSTWYEAPGDPVHIHEATHQIFRNRLALGGGGSWFQEGVAEFMSTKDNERGDAARAVKKGRGVPLPQFVQVQSLIFSTPGNDTSGADQAGDQYKQAALFIEFLQKSKFAKGRFLDGIRAFGSAPSNNVKALEAAANRVYQTDLAGLQKEFEAYCKKR